MFAGGCQLFPRAESRSSMPAPTYQQLQAAHNERIAGLNRLYAQGVIEIRWKDDRGAHFEQGDLELWLQLPTHTALRVDKLGEVLLWLGSNDQRWWLFDLTNSNDRPLYLGEHGEPIRTTGPAAISIRPLALVNLLGLCPLPDYSSTPAQTLPAVQHVPLPQAAKSTSGGARSRTPKKAWMIDLPAGKAMDAASDNELANATTAAAEHFRTYFDDSLLPVRVEILNARGDVTFSSSLGRYSSTQFRGLSPLASPKMPTLIDIAQHTRPTTEGQDQPSGQSQVKIALNSAGETENPQEVLSRVFDVDRLIKALRPQRIERQVSGRQPVVSH
jgi:hypothetical protein